MPNRGTGNALSMIKVSNIYRSHLVGDHAMHFNSLHHANNQAPILKGNYHPKGINKEFPPSTYTPGLAICLVLGEQKRELGSISEFLHIHDLGPGACYCNLKTYIVSNVLLIVYIVEGDWEEQGEEM